MPLTLGMKLYALGHRHDAHPGQNRPARPVGELAWLHVPSVEQISPMLALAGRLIEEDGMAILMTAPFELPPRDRVIHQPPPGDSLGDTQAFVAHWRPDVAIFSEGELRPAVLHEAGERRIPLLMVNSRLPRLLRDRDAWYPGLMRSALTRFAHVATVDEAAARAFRKAGAPVSNVMVTGRMEDESAALPCLEAERVALARLMAARPVWFAAGVPEAEEAAVLSAQRAVQRQSHRLLLILMPANPDTADALADRLEGEDGWVVARRNRDEEPDAAVEVLIVDNPAEAGLWYRLAPLTYLGGSLAGPGPTRNPMEAAALGSAILHGPKTGAYGAVFGRLGAARATRAVASAADLADAVSDLLSPDRAARLAEAAWTVASDGAEVTERLVAKVRQVIEAGA